MSYGNILGEILGQLGQSRSRIDQTGRNLGAGGGGLESIFGQVQDALSRSGIDLGALVAGDSLAQMGQYASGFLQPDFSSAHLQAIGRGALETLAMSAIGTLLAALLGLDDAEQEQQAQDRGIDLKRELSTLVRRYPGELQRTRSWSSSASNWR